MKVLILANYDVGLYKFRKDLINKFLSDNHEVYISLPYGEFVPKLEELGCIFVDTPVDRRGLNPIVDFKLMCTYWKLLKEIKPDVVVTYTIKPNIYGGLVCSACNVPYGVNITGLGTAFQNDGLLKKFVVTLYKMACRKAKVVFFENETNQNVFIDNKIVKQEKTCLLAGAGINLREYPYIEYPSEEDGIHFLFVGRIMKEKGVDELFDVAVDIKEKYGKRAVFDVVGFFEEGYKEKIEELQKRGIINFHGYQSDVKKFYECCHCVVLPSYHEGMSNVLLEAAATGRALITSEIPGCKEAVIDGESGFLCEVKNSGKLYEKLSMFLTMSAEQRVKMGQKSRRLMEKQFDKEKVVQKTYLNIR